MPISEDFRAILGVGREADADEIRQAYRRAAKLAHPDGGGSSEAFRRVRQAADILLADLASGGDLKHPYRDGDRTSLQGDWTDVDADLAAIWRLARGSVIVIAPQKIGLSPFVHGAALNAPAFNWLARTFGPRGENWDFHTGDSVTRIFFRRADDAHRFKLRFF